MARRNTAPLEMVCPGEGDLHGLDADASKSVPLMHLLDAQQVSRDVHGHPVAIEWIAAVLRDDVARDEHLSGGGLECSAQCHPDGAALAGGDAGSGHAQHATAYDRSEVRGVSRRVVPR